MRGEQPDSLLSTQVWFPLFLCVSNLASVTAESPNTRRGSFGGKRQNTERQTPFRWHSNRKWHRFDSGYTTNLAQGWQEQGTVNPKARSAPSHCPQSEPGPLKVLMSYHSSIRNLPAITLVRKLVTQEERTSALTSCLFCRGKYMKYWKVWVKMGSQGKRCWVTRSWAAEPHTSEDTWLEPLNLSSPLPQHTPSWVGECVIIMLQQ